MRPSAGIAWYLRPLLIFSFTGACIGATASHGDEPNYHWRNVEIVGGGYVPGVVFNQTEPGLAYARTDIGGAYRWQPRSKHGSRCSTGWVPMNGV